MTTTRSRLVAPAGAIALAGITCSALVLPVPAASAAPGGPRGNAPTTMALRGDTLYRDAQRAVFPAPDPRRQRRPPHPPRPARRGREERLHELRRHAVAGPFVLTPGGNEWTDCHRPAAGGYVPTERLDAVRAVFYPEPGRTLGEHEMSVVSQAAAQPEYGTYVENVQFQRSRVVFAIVHVVGSESDPLPWSGIGESSEAPRADRVAELEARRAANLAWIAAAFDEAERAGAAGVVLLLQAEPLATPGFQAERDLIVQRAAEFGRPVLLAHGDEHRNEEPGYAGVPNLTRLETFGDTVTEWLRVTARPAHP